jgi:hypothetical protein
VGDILLAEIMDSAGLEDASPVLLAGFECELDVGEGGALSKGAVSGFSDFEPSASFLLLSLAFVLLDLETPFACALLSLACCACRRL